MGWLRVRKKRMLANVGYIGHSGGLGRGVTWGAGGAGSHPAGELLSADSRVKNPTIGLKSKTTRYLLCVPPEAIDSRHSSMLHCAPRTLYMP